MKIRSITYFFNPQWPFDENAMLDAANFIAAARPAFEAAGYEVQSARLATVPFPYLIQSGAANQVVALAAELEKAVKPYGYEYIAIGPALPESPDTYDLIPEVLAATKDVFVSGLLTVPGGGVSLPAVQACAGVIERTAVLSPDGFANLRFGALANILPGGPFLPAAYHGKGRPAFAIATEAADLAVEAVSEATSLREARQTLVSRVEEEAHRLAGIGEELEQSLQTKFGGLDFTLAPFPEQDKSFGTAIEALGVPAVGLHGSLAAAAFLTDSLDHARYPRAGFNGLMLPVLEDFTLARRAEEGFLTVKDLLLYSAVCGTGLDTLPLPGDIRREQIAAVLLDVAALAQRLNKPLIARLMPVPGKAAGEMTEFDFAFFANSRVLKVDAQPLTGLLAGNETFDLQKRP